MELLAVEDRLPIAQVEPVVPDMVEQRLGIPGPRGAQILQRRDRPAHDRGSGSSRLEAHVRDHLVSLDLVEDEVPATAQQEPTSSVSDLTLALHLAHGGGVQFGGNQKGLTKDADQLVVQLDSPWQRSGVSTNGCEDRQGSSDQQERAYDAEGGHGYLSGDVDEKEARHGHRITRGFRCKPLSATHGAGMRWPDQAAKPQSSPSATRSNPNKEENRSIAPNQAILAAEVGTQPHQRRKSIRTGEYGGHQRQRQATPAMAGAGPEPGPENVTTADLADDACHLLDSEVERQYEVSVGVAGPAEWSA